ncbi:unnamed protein product, partial [Prorocentrum cordatum]
MRPRVSLRGGATEPAGEAERAGEEAKGTEEEVIKRQGPEGGERRSRRGTEARAEAQAWRRGSGRTLCAGRREHAAPQSSAGKKAATKASHFARHRALTLRSPAPLGSSGGAASGSRRLRTGRSRTPGRCSSAAAC